jgi:hypothetical protein
MLAEGAGTVGRESTSESQSMAINNPLIARDLLASDKCELFQERMVGGVKANVTAALCMGLGTSLGSGD